jgi:GNAT superfamily N-acetyltransferase
MQMSCRSDPGSVHRMPIGYMWRGEFTDAEVKSLHAEGFGHDDGDLARCDIRARTNANSLGWVCARSDTGTLVGWVNVAWDGATHAFVIDTVTSAAYQRRGIGTRLVTLAAQEARAAGCEWLHVDFEPHLTSFYVDSCGFRPTNAGLIHLSG